MTYIMRHNFITESQLDKFAKTGKILKKKMNMQIIISSF